ncbi:MAG: hypothetical protein NXI00_21225 [Cytophagales bacterium]|nr:hypothetical protein [Cytophagales bacterium]
MTNETAFNVGQNMSFLATCPELRFGIVRALQRNADLTKPITGEIEIIKNTDKKQEEKQEALKMFLLEDFKGGFATFPVDLFNEVKGSVKLNDGRSLSYASIINFLLAQGVIIEGDGEAE